MKQQRSDWFKHRLPAIAALPDRLVFIDETAVKTNLTRLRGRAKRGERLTMDAPFGRWGTQTLIAGLTQDALIASWVIKGAMDAPHSLPTFAKCWSQRSLQARSSSSTTSRPIETRKLLKLCDLYEPEECWNYFKAAGYVAG